MTHLSKDTTCRGCAKMSSFLSVADPLPSRYPFHMRTSTLLLLSLPVISCADSIDRERLKNIDTATEAAIKRGDCPGAVVLVLHNGDVVHRKAYGHRSLQPEKTAMTVDTVFDMASLTKPIATATSAMVLIEQGKLRLSEKVAT